MSPDFRSSTSWSQNIVLVWYNSSLNFSRHSSKRKLHHSQKIISCQSVFILTSSSWTPSRQPCKTLDGDAASLLDNHSPICWLAHNLHNDVTIKIFLIMLHLVTMMLMTRLVVKKTITLGGKRISSLWETEMGRSPSASISQSYWPPSSTCWDFFSSGQNSLL